MLLDAGDVVARPGSLASTVFEALASAPLGSVVAVWPDGSVSTHRSLGFRHRKLADGRFEEPLTSFVARSESPSVWEIEDRLERAARRGS